MSRRDKNPKERWLDDKHTKGKPSKSCLQHSFCNIEYEWADDSHKLKERNCPIVASMMHIVLPDSQDPPNKKVTYAGMTEQNLDDWMAQSLNRNIRSMLNPQKKYNLPPGLEQQLRARYRGLKHQSVKSNHMQDELYFPPAQKRKAENHLLYKSRKKELNLQELVVPGERLSPKEDSKGTPIRFREQKKFAKKAEARRRGGVYLANDYYYQRFFRECVEEPVSKVATIQPEVPKQQPIRVVNSDLNMSIYSYNMENVFRKSVLEPVPSSLIESEMTRVAQVNEKEHGTQNKLIEKFSKLQQEYKQKINDKTKQSLLTIANTKQSTHHDSPTGQSKRKPRQSSIPIPTASLAQKVKQLLNDTQLHSQNLDQQLLSFRVHCDQLLVQKFQSKPHIKWMIKAQQNIKQKTYQLAIDCYKQSLIISPDNFAAVYNVACLMEKQNTMAQAKKWFLLAQEFGQHRQKTIFGLSVVCFKKSEFKESLKYIDSIIRDCGDAVPQLYYYVRALNQKKLGMVEQAKSDYKLIQGNVVPENYNILVNLMFSLVFAKMRRLQVKFNCLTYMHFRNTIDYILQENKKYVIDNAQIFEDPKEYENIALQLSKLNFFRRFPVSIIKRLIPSLHYHRIPKSTIMLADRDHTAIILSGAIAIKNHQRNFQRPQLIGLLLSGDSIGAGKLDNFISDKPNMWYYSETDAEYVSLRQPDFNSFWKAQFTLELDRKYAFLKNVKLFKNLSEISMMRLCEMFELKTYSKNAILFNDCSYRARPITKLGMGFGLHSKNSEDWATIKFKNTGELLGLKRTSSKLYGMIQRNRGKINSMKFKNLRYPGVYVLLNGVLEVEDDCGFRTTNFISRGDYFGENLIFQSEGFQRYGRVLVNSETAELYFLSLKSVSRLLLYEKQLMKESSQNRKQIETLAFIYKRFHQVLKVKVTARQQLRRLRQGI